MGSLEVRAEQGPEEHAENERLHTGACLLARGLHTVCIVSSGGSNQENE
jgi:hypothetical protein